MSKMRVVVVVSSDPSDIYFANQLMKQLNVVGVIVESQRAPRDNRPILIKALALLPHPLELFTRLYDKFIGRPLRRNAIFNQDENQADFGPDGQQLDEQLAAERDINVRTTEGPKDINRPENVAWIRDQHPDLIAVCGTSILKSDILSIPEKGVVNLHGGLAQEYRGLFTTDWAVFNEEPEYVGATVHFVSPGIDDGEVIYQGRPDITPNDHPNSLYVKVVQLGIRMMARAIREIEAGTVRSQPLPEAGRLYRGASYTHKVQLETWDKLNQGVISNYLNDRTSRDQKVVPRLLNPFQDDE